MNLKTLLSEIDYGKDKIVAIFKKREAKIENIKFLWDELNKYKEELYGEENSSGNESINQKILNVIRVSTFIEEILLNGFQPLEYNFETRQTIDNAKISRDFINDWTNIDKILTEDEIVVIPESITEQSNLLDSRQSKTKKEMECLTKYCSIL